MALFPAYQNLSDENPLIEKASQNTSWLQNESCPPEITIRESIEVINDSKSQENDDTLLQGYKTMEDNIFTEKEKTYEDNTSRNLYKQKRKSKSKSELKKKSSAKSVLKRKHSASHDLDEKQLRKATKVFKILDNSVTSSFPTKNLNKNIFLAKSISAILPVDVIYFDFVGEKNNLLFATTHYTQFAKYRKRKKVLGKDRTRLGLKPKKPTRYFGKFEMIVSDSASKLKLCNDDQFPEIVKEHTFILLEHNKKKHIENSLVNPLRILDASTENYISGKGNTVTTEIITEKTEYTYFQMRTKEFNENIQKEPNNISLWLDFVQFQDKIDDFWLGNETKRKKKTNLRQISEKKLSILDAAIKKNNECRILFLERLRIGQDIWDQDQLIEEWDKLLNKFSNDKEIWHQLLIFYQTYFSTFHLNNVVKIHIRYKEKLLLSQESDVASNYCQLIDDVGQLAYLWKQGGFLERSIALFQALIELNLYCPSLLQKPGINPEIVTDIFEAFWDSKAPRFGEKDAVGWAKFIEKRQPVTFPELILEGTNDEEDIILREQSDKHKVNLWLELEFSRELNHWLPWQQDPDLCEDSERLVSFSVIRPHLFFIKNESSLFYLIVQFLSFLGVTIPEDIMMACNHSAEQGSLSRLRIESLQDLLLKEDFPDKIQEDIAQFYFPVIGPSVRKLSSEGYFQFICGVINLVADLFPIKYRVYLAIIIIRLYKERCLMLKRFDPNSLSKAVKGCKKQIKSLLKNKDFQNNLQIYYEFAIFEKSLENIEEALKIHAMSLTLGLQITNLSSECEEDACVLLKHLLSIIKIEFDKEEISMDKRHINSAQNLICSSLLDNKFSNEPTPPSGVNILKAKKKLNYHKVKALDKIKTEGVYPLSSGFYITFLSLLQFISTGYKSACLIFEDFLEHLNKKAKSQNELKELKLKELVYENYVWFLHLTPKFKHLHLTLPMTPLDMRSIVNAAVEVAPNNLYLLHMLSNCQFQIWRDILSKTKKLDNEEDASILVTIFQLMPHIRKAVHDMSEPGGVSNYQLVTCLETAVSTTQGRHCPLLWRLYLRITHRFSSQNFKTLTYRAMNNCPFAKSIYLDCIQLIPESLSEILKVMTEKGIRVRLPLEELEVLVENEEEYPDGNAELQEENCDILLQSKSNENENS